MVPRGSRGTPYLKACPPTPAPPFCSTCYESDERTSPRLTGEAARALNAAWSRAVLRVGLTAWGEEELLAETNLKKEKFGKIELKMES